MTFKTSLRIIFIIFYFITAFILRGYAQGYNDIIINEILFDPETKGSRFVEFYNRSHLDFNIKSLKIADLSKNNVKTIDSSYVLMAKTYVILAEDTAYIRARYQVPNSVKNFIKMKLPTWDSDSGNITLYRQSGTKREILDSFNYKKEFHNVLLANTEGVSLERINPNKTTNEASNWLSASSLFHYATPAYENSQLDTTAVGDMMELITLPYKTFSPDDDGTQDYLLIHYDLDKAGYLLNTAIYDIEGRLVKKLNQNTSLASKGDIRWLGDNEAGQRTANGTYILYFELVHPTGTIQRIKKVCVLVTNF